MEKFIAHVRENDKAIQSLDSHQEGVAKRAKQYADEFGFGELAYNIGMLHDKGKEQKEWQNYIKKVSGLEENAKFNEHVNHAYVGALIAKKIYPQIYPLLAYPILGHHAGLHDYIDYEAVFNDKTIPNDVITPDKTADLAIPSTIADFGNIGCHHLFRMLYSCLVDADYLDTEEFMDERTYNLRGRKSSIEELWDKLKTYLDNLKEKSEENHLPINDLRNDIQHSCYENAESAPGFYSLTVPTGGGKTLSSLVWAIRHAIKYNKKRIIIAIPYTSIIVQTAEILRTIFGEENVLEHHSNVDYSSYDNNESPDINKLRNRLATENWDYPIIITTNVQLFESMFSNKPSVCRKLHNIVNSILILDEAQMLPIDFLQPIIDSLKVYQKSFGVSVLFTTASMPALKDDVVRYGKTMLRGIGTIQEIVPDEMNLTEKLKRVDLHFIDKEQLSYDEVAEKLMRHKKVLCIVNTRKDAQEIFTRLPKEGKTYHLSRMMCSKHINDVLERIKKDLNNNEDIIRVVSTQLVEAGVDIDFPVVFRQEAGLDSILQSAGRCNRNGKLAPSLGQVFVFALDKPLPKGYISHSNNSRKNMVNTTEWFGKDAICEYFLQLYSRINSFDTINVKTRLCDPWNFDFKSISEKFKLKRSSCDL